MPDGRGGFETVPIPLDDLTPAQAAQAIGRTGVNSAAKQRALSAECRRQSTPAPAPVKVVYRIVGDRVKFEAPVELTLPDMARIMVQMGA